MCHDSNYRVKSQNVQTESVRLLPSDDGLLTKQSHQRTSQAATVLVVVKRSRGEEADRKV